MQTRPAIRLPVQPLTAAAVVREARAGRPLSELGRLVELDPALALSVLRMANAPLFGMSRRVGSVRQAIVLLGGRTIGNLATGSTASLVLDDDGSGAPDGFWTHALATAAACAAVARRIGAVVDDAFAVGLIHDVGTLVLHAEDAEGLAALANPSFPRPAAELLEAEVTHFGRHHADAGAELLAAWNLPDAVVRAVRAHHATPDVAGSQLARVLIAGHTAAAAALAGTSRAAASGLGDALAALRLTSLKPQDLLTEITAETRRMAAELTGAAA
jgi:putative nucleotidyltransferase with HDIG domain